jgi:hypothetical protein
MTTSNSESQSSLRRVRRSLEQLSVLKAVGLLSVLLVLLVTVLMLQRVREAESEYQAAMAQIEEIQAIAASDEIYSLTQEDMSWLEHEFATLQERIDHIDDLADLPFGLSGAVSSTPWVSDRFNAAMETLEIGRMLAESGQVIANIGDEALEALDQTGIRYEEGQTSETWLDVLNRREDDLNSALDKMDTAIDMREEVDDEKLPSGVRNRLAQMDSVIEEFSSQRELADDLPLAFAAFGADTTLRYLALFQNPAETRPTGGFVGTIAFVDIRRGQIHGYEFHDVYDVSQDYQDNIDAGLRPPWAISEYVRPDYLQYQDANWWPDFPVSAELIADMTRDAGWGEPDSVVAVQPEVISDLISITGAITVDVDGDDREITQDNLLEEAERQRRLAREGEERDADHKEVISLIGEVLLEHLAAGERDKMIDAAFLMIDALDRRDMQVYHQDDSLTSYLEQRNWAGRIKPDPAVPTIAPVLANITGLKTSLAMQMSLDLEILESDTPGVTEGILTVSLDHLGAEEGDPFYEGFQRWWVDLMLPAGAELIDANQDPVPDPEASNGGAYVINLPVGETEEITIQFKIPRTGQLMIRRQPGLISVDGSVSSAGCDDTAEFAIVSDTLVDLSGECPVIEEPEFD